MKKVSLWITDTQIKLKSERAKYIIINFCTSLQFRTRLFIEDSLSEQVREAKLKGIIISNDLTWHANTANKKIAFQRRIILRKIFEFKVATRGKNQDDNTI